LVLWFYRGIHQKREVKVKHLQRFFSSDASGGIVLIIAAALAMVMANQRDQRSVSSFLETPVQLRSGRWKSTRTCCCGSTMR
jgi:Na+/H+ antiporter NhaA